MNEDPSPYFDQEPPQVPIVGMIADFDSSQPYELEAVALFKAKPGYLLVYVSSCSCWPDLGRTTQNHYTRKADVDRALAEYPQLKDAVQRANWMVSE